MRETPYRKEIVIVDDACISVITGPFDAETGGKFPPCHFQALVYGSE